MPIYCFKCPDCGHQCEMVIPLHLIGKQSTPCTGCGKPAMARDYKREAASNDFHPTRDLYAEKLKMQGKKRERSD